MEQINKCDSVMNKNKNIEQLNKSAEKSDISDQILNKNVKQNISIELKSPEKSNQLTL